MTARPDLAITSKATCGKEGSRGQEAVRATRQGNKRVSKAGRYKHPGARKSLPRLEGKNQPVQRSNLRKPSPHSVASSGMKDTPTYRVFSVPPRAVIKSYPSHWGRLWTTRLSASYLAAGGFKFYVLCRKAYKCHCSKQDFR